MGKIIDISGQTFGFLTAQYPTRVNGRFGWHCKCVCGKEIDVDSNNLRTGKTKSCGCQRKKLVSQSNTKDLTGKQFDDLLVLGPTENRTSSGIVWKCQCICGNIVYIPTGNLTSHHTTSCGCKKGQRIGEKLHLKLTGKRFGKLTVLKELPSQNYESRWLCQCDCGNQIESIGWHLTTGKINSCGCLKSSKGEFKIAQILTENNIPFETEKTFLTCRSPKGYLLRFDFFVDNKYLIEYDGEQHFLNQPNKIYTKNKLERIVESDKIKTQWCLDNQIPLIRINYTQFQNLTIQDLLLKKE